MPAELVNCPQCQRALRVPSDLVGKLVKCPTCGHTFTGNPDTAESAPAPAPAEAPPRTSRVNRDEDDYDEEAARRRRRRNQRDENEDEDDDDRPRRRRRRSRWADDDDDDYEDRRPRRRRTRYLVPHRGSTILLLGILSFFVAQIILGPIAWIMGNSDLEEMRAGRMDPEGYDQTNTGRICGMIATILGIVAIVGVMIIICAGVAAVESSRPRY